MQSPVLRSPQLHQGTPTILKVNRKIEADSPLLKAGNRKIEVDTPTQIKAANKKLEVLDTPAQIKAANKKLEVLDTPAQIKAANKKLEVLDTPAQIKAANKKLEIEAPAAFIKSAQKKLIEHDTPTMLKQAARKASVLESPISSVLKSKKRFFKAVKFNEEITSLQDDNNNYNEYQEIKPYKIMKSEMSEKKVAKEDVKTIAKPEICSDACKVRTSGCTESCMSKPPTTTLTPENKKSWSEGAESPLAPGMLKAREKNDLTGSQVEKLLLERLLIRKDLKLASMQERIKEIQKEMELIKENHAKIVKNLREEAEGKECEIERLQAENTSLKSLPGLCVLQTILYLCHLPTLALSYLLYLPMMIYNCVWNFYSCIFHTSADWAEAMCFFLEFSAIKLRWKLREYMKTTKPVLSPPPKKIKKGSDEKTAEEECSNKTGRNNNNVTKRKRKRFYKN